MTPNNTTLQISHKAKVWDPTISINRNVTFDHQPQLGMISF